jgi:branched-chain amino acid transport system permease protein
MAVAIPEIGGFSLDPYTHPTRYGGFVLAVLVLVALAVGNLRRSGAGRQMLAVRSNERAAAVAGVNVAAVKLKAFMVSSVIAAVAGGLLAYSNPFLVFGNGQFAAMPSITLVTLVYIGGIASVGGAVMAGFMSVGGVAYVLLNHIHGFDDVYLLISGVALIWTVIAHPDGVVVDVGARLGRLRARLTRPSAYGTVDIKQASGR